MDKLADFKKFVRRDVPLAMHTWFQIGGPAEYFAEPHDRDDLCALLSRCHQENIPVRVLGFGSNLLIGDKGVRGVVLRLTAAAFTEIRHGENHRMHAGSGAKLGRVVTSSVHEGLAGLEGLIGIPGTVGGAIKGNTGTNQGDIGEQVERLVVVRFDGRISELVRSEMNFAHRSSTLDDLIILESTFQLSPEDPVELSKRMQKLWIVRRTAQPTSPGCTGRLFTDPRGQMAGELIAMAGLKGMRIGGASISERDPNFVILDPECSASDVLRLIELVQEQVSERTDTDLELQLEIWDK